MVQGRPAEAPPHPDRRPGLSGGGDDVTGSSGKKWQQLWAPRSPRTTRALGQKPAGRAASGGHTGSDITASGGGRGTASPVRDTSLARGRSHRSSPMRSRREDITAWQQSQGPPCQQPTDCHLGGALQAGPPQGGHPSAILGQGTFSGWPPPRAAVARRHALPSGGTAAAVAPPQRPRPRAAAPVGCHRGKRHSLSGQGIFCGDGITRRRRPWVWRGHRGRLGPWEVALSVVVTSGTGRALAVKCAPGHPGARRSLWVPEVM